MQHHVVGSLPSSLRCTVRTSKYMHTEGVCDPRVVRLQLFTTARGSRLVPTHPHPRGSPRFRYDVVTLARAARLQVDSSAPASEPKLLWLARTPCDADPSVPIHNHCPTAFETPLASIQDRTTNAMGPRLTGRRGRLGPRLTGRRGRLGPRHVPGAHQDAARGQPRDPDTAPPVIRPTPELPETHRDAARGHRNTTGKPCSQLQSPDTAPFITRPAPELPGAHQDIARSQPRDPDTAQPNIGPAPDTNMPELASPKSSLRKTPTLPFPPAGP